MSAKQNKTAIRIENCIDNCKNLMVLKITQFGTLITIVRTVGSYNNQKQKN